MMHTLGILELLLPEFHGIDALGDPRRVPPLYSG